MIDDKQGQMLSSLLEKPHRKIKIDKLVKTTENGRELLIEPEEVLEETKEHYQGQFRARYFDQKICKDRWAKIYEPKKSIQEIWYVDLDKEINEEEWLEMLADLKKNTAPGISGITYMLIQAASAKVQEIFRLYAEKCIRTGMVPRK